MSDMNIQHPDITAAERTGYPARRMVSIPLTDKIVAAYLWEQKSELIDWIISQEAAYEFIRIMQDDFDDWCKGVLEG